MEFTEALDRAVARVLSAPESDRDRVIAEEALPMLLGGASPEVFLAWCAEHREHRFDLAEAVADVCAKPPELAAQVLRIVVENVASR